MWRTPAYWRHKGAAFYVLQPLSWLYGLGARLDAALTRPQTLNVPVICIGNCVAGGAGKTPVAITVAQKLQEMNVAPFAISRGYGGTCTLPTRVNAQQHTAREVGDEPLLLARVLPTIVGNKRLKNCRSAIASGAHCLVLDDGYQDRSILGRKSVLVLDGEYGIGNGALLPAGPLRESFSGALRRADAVVIIGQDLHALTAQIPAHIPLLHARFEPKNAAQWAGKKLIAFAGIARPEKFFATLRAAGADILQMHSFADHHAYTPDELEFLRAQAERSGASLITTEKDFVRIETAQRANIHTLEIECVWQEPEKISALLHRWISAG